MSPPNPPCSLYVPSRARGCGGALQSSPRWGELDAVDGKRQRWGGAEGLPRKVQVWQTSQAPVSLCASGQQGCRDSTCLALYVLK